MSSVAVAPADPSSDGTEISARIIDAALLLVARWGVAKTSLADVAKEAGCSRATLYRAFPGGKNHLFAALGERELFSYADAVIEAIDEADDLSDALTRGLVVAARLLRDHDAAQFVLNHEPGLLMPFMGFKQVEVLYRYTARTFGPCLRPYLDDDRAEWATEWVARLFISYLFNPDPHVDLIDVEETRSLVERFVIPVFEASQATRRSALAV